MSAKKISSNKQIGDLNKKQIVKQDNKPISSVKKSSENISSNKSVKPDYKSKKTKQDYKQSIDYKKFEFKFDPKRFRLIAIYSVIILVLGFIVYSKSANYILVHCDDNIFVLDYQQFNSDINNLKNCFKKSLGTTYYRPLLAATFVIDANIGETIRKADEEAQRKQMDEMAQANSKASQNGNPQGQKNNQNQQIQNQQNPDNSSGFFLESLGFIYNTILKTSWSIHQGLSFNDTTDTKSKPVNNISMNPTGINQAQNVAMVNNPNNAKTFQPVSGLTDPRVFHVTNILIHLLGAWLVFFFLLKLDYSINMSFFIGLLFIMHPILCPAASWISGRNDSMISLFVILSFLSLMSFMNVVRRQYYLKDYIKMSIFYVLHIFFFAMSLFTKEIGGVLPLVALSYIVFFRNEKPLTWRNIYEKLFTMKNVMLGIGWVIVVLYWSSMRSDATRGINNPDTIGLDAFWQNWPSIFAMLGKIVLPIKMIALSSYEWLSITSGALLIIGLVVLVLKIKTVNKSNVIFGLAWFIVFLLPTLLVRIVFVEDFFDYAEHRAYLTMLGVIIIIAEILIALKIDFKKPITIAIASVLVLIFTARSFAYEKTFEDRKTFWTHMTYLYPNKSRGYYDLAKAYFVENNLLYAETLYRKGIQRNPKNKNLYIDLSAVFMRRNMFDSAAKNARIAIGIDPTDNIANYNYAKSLISMNRIQEAIPYLEYANSRNSQYAGWFVDLGIAYSKLNQFPKAIAPYRRAIAIDPNDFYAASNLGVCYAMTGQIDNAIAMWNRSTTINPHFYDPYNNMIKYFILNKQFEKAITAYKNLRVNGGEMEADVRQMYQQNGLPM